MLLDSAALDLCPAAGDADLARGLGRVLPARFELRLASQSGPLWNAIAGAPLLFALIALLQLHIDRQTRSAVREKEESLLRSGTLVKKLSLGYDSLLADIYWTRAVQYDGTRVGTHDRGFELLWPLLELSTALDPQLMAADRFGARLSLRDQRGRSRTNRSRHRVGKTGHRRILRLAIDRGDQEPARPEPHRPEKNPVTMEGYN